VYRPLRVSNHWAAGALPTEQRVEHTRVRERWASQFDQTATAKRNVQGETLEEENRRLRKENERLRMEKTILKKAAAFFAKEDE
jgi:transposase